MRKWQLHYLCVTIAASNNSSLVMTIDLTLTPIGCCGTAGWLQWPKIRLPPDLPRPFRSARSRHWPISFAQKKITRRVTWVAGHWTAPSIFFFKKICSLLLFHWSQLWRPFDQIEFNGGKSTFLFLSTDGVDGYFHLRRSVLTKRRRLWTERSIWFEFIHSFTNWWKSD